MWLEMLPHFPLHFDVHTGPANLNLKFHFSSAWGGTDNPKTSPQSDRMVLGTAAWDIVLL